MTIEHINAEIDATADLLREGDDFLNPRVWRQKTASFGLPGLDLPIEYGGSGWPATKMLEVFKHAGTHNLNFRDIVGGAHVRPLLKSKEPAVLEIVRQVASGNAYIAIAITEPEVGSNVSGIKSTSRKVDGGYELAGEKRFNARLEQASHVIVFTQGTTGKEGKLNVFVMPIDTPGLVIESLAAHGLTGNSYGGLKFENLFVPESHRIGADGEGLRIFFEHFLYWRLMQTAAALGTGENALQQMADRLKTREAFGACECRRNAVPKVGSPVKVSFISEFFLRVALLWRRVFRCRNNFVKAVDSWVRVSAFEEFPATHLSPVV